MDSNPSELVIEIAELLEETAPVETTKCCIYRVPNEIHKVNKDAYTPRVVSIGPFHHGDERLQRTEFHKRVYLKQFVTRTQRNLKDVVSFIEELEQSVRFYYAENIKFDKKQLAKIILLDACFIIELFLRHYYQGGWSRDDPLPMDVCSMNNLELDLLLLENQLPFCVLEKLFNLTFPSEGDPSFLQLTFNYFAYYNRQGLTPHDVHGVDICHFTDLLRHFYLQQPSSNRPSRVVGWNILQFSATKLQEAGLKFKINAESRCFLGLKFSKSVLEIPILMLERDSTEVLFRNMMAFEQCHCPFEPYILDYISFFDCLIDTDKDVDVLIEKGIIVNNLDDSDAVAKLFHSLPTNTVMMNLNSDYQQICKKLNEFYKNPYQKLKATLRRDCCKAISIAGMSLNFLTLILTIFSGIQVMQQSKNA